MRTLLSLPQSVRPTGIKVLIILFIISIGFSTGVYFLIDAATPSLFGGDSFLFGMEIFLDILIIIGLYNAKPLARKFLLVIGWIGLITGIISIIFIPIAILFGILVWYLRKPHVKEYFGIDVV